MSARISSPVNDEAPGTTWAETPSRRRADVPAHPAAAVAVALFVALVGPVARSASLPSGLSVQLLVVGVLATGAVLSVPSGAWYLRIAVAAVVGAVLVPSQGDMIAVWLAAGLLLAAWISQGRAPLPFLPKPGPGSTGPVVVLCTVAAWQGTTMDATWQPFVPFALAAAAPMATWWGHGFVDRLALRLGAAVAAGVSTLAFGLLGVFALLVPWLTQRTLRIDPLHPTEGWDGRERRPLRPARPWTTDPTTRRPAIRAYAVAVLVIVALLGGFTWIGSSGFDDLPPPTINRLLRAPDAREPAGSPDWYDEYREDVAWALDERVGLRPFEVHRLLDVRTRHVNVSDGYRESWSPPRCDCQRFTVWIYGGNAAFGFEQRDEHTIASELAREAVEQDIWLDVHNRGIPGQAHWRNALRFAIDLSAHPPPDLVVFYDGFEDVTAAAALADRELGDVRAPYEPFIEDLYDEIHGTSEPLPPPDEVQSLGWPLSTEMPAGDPGELAARRYERARETSTDTAAAAGIPVAYFWQAFHASSASVDTESSDPGVARLESAFATAAALLPDDVIDINSVAGADSGSFVDPFHHGETGARAVARALLSQLRPELTRLGATGGSGS